jgi:LuxR family maltose regulon positive regulatory protein
MARFHQGRLGEAAEYYRQMANLGIEGKASQIALGVVGQVGLAAICLERNELDAAAQHLEEGRRLGEYRVGANTLVSAAVTRSRLRQIGGDGEAAQQALDEVSRLGHVRDSAPAMHRLARQRAWLALASGDLDGAERLLRGLDAPARNLGGEMRVPTPFQEAQTILQARLHLARGQGESALEELARIEPAASAAGRWGRIIEIRLLKALALQTRGRTAEALVELARSLEAAEPEGTVRVYLDEGPAATALLEALCQSEVGSGRVRAYAARLLAASNVVARQTVEPGWPAATSGLVEPLTEREHEVLRLIAAGLSGPEIARELVLAYSTIKSHTKAIYGKLGVHSRYEAVERARTLKLI